MILKENKKTNLSRRDFLKALSVTTAGFCLPSFNIESLNICEGANTRSIMAIRAVKGATESLDNTPRDPDLRAQRLSFVSAYFERFGYPVELVNQPGINDNILQLDMNISDLSVTRQIGFLKKLEEKIGEKFSFEIPVKKIFEDPDILEKIPPGAAVYPEKPMSHSGYNAYHNAMVYLGVFGDRPMFAEYAQGIKIDGSLNMLSKMYEETSRGLDIEPKRQGINDPRELKVYFFDTISAARKMWRDGGAVEPNSNLLINNGFDISLTVNINDGTIALYSLKENIKKLKFEDGSEDFYSVVGRKIKINHKLSEEYDNSLLSADNSFYDGGSGILYNKNGVPRRTYTPMLISSLGGFMRITNFGNIGGYTDTSILHPLLRDDKDILSKDNRHSSYTVHRVPQDTSNQEMLSRELNLMVANKIKKPPSYPDLNRSSGCVNLEKNSWETIKKTLQGYLYEDKKIAVIFSLPGFNQDLQINSFGNTNIDPFTNGLRCWNYGDIEDRTGFYSPKEYSLNYDFDTPEKSYGSYGRRDKFIR